MPGGVAAHPAAKAGTSYHEIGAAGDMDNNKASVWARTPGPDGQTPIQKAGLEQLSGQTGKNDPLHIQLPKSDWGKTASNDSIPTKGPNAGKAPKGSGDYQVAGTVPIGLSEEDAAKAKADLDAHRMQPVHCLRPWMEDKDLRPTANPPAQPAPSAPLIQFGGIHPENIFQSHPPNSPTLGPVFSDRPNGQAAPDNPSEHGDAPPDVRSPEDNYDATHRIVPVRPDAPMNGVRGNPQFNAVRPEPAIPTTPQAPNTVRPDAPMDSVHGNPLFNAVRPEPPVDPTNPAPIVNAVRPEPPPPGAVGTINPHTDKSPEVVGTINPDTDKSQFNTPLPPPRPTSEANKPTRSAQPVSSSNPPGNSAIPNTPAQDPRFTQIDRPNASPQNSAYGHQGQMQSTALDLSHLWGSNPPIADRAPTPTPASAPTPPVSSVPNLKASDFAGMTDDMVMGSAKGGPIQRFSKGGIPTRPTMHLAGGGPSESGQTPNDATLAAAYNNSGQVPANWYSQPAYEVSNPGVLADRNTLQTDLSNMLYGAGNTGPAIQTAAPSNSTGIAAWDALTPTQQQAYITGQSDLNTLNTQPFAMQDSAYKSAIAGLTPAPAAPAPAPAAATPAAAAPAAVAPTVVPVATSENPQAVDPVAFQAADPTTTTVTGAVKVPNSIQAKSYDPNVDAQTGAGFANTSNTGGTDYSVGSDDLLKQNNNGQISGYNNNTTILSRKGGPIKGFANGGAIPKRPTMGFAAGGATGGGNNNFLQSLYGGTYNGPMPSGSSMAWSGTPYAQLAPNQQAWADTTQNLWNSYAAAKGNSAQQSSLMGQYTAMPDAVWPTAAPAAPTPLNTPAPASVDVPTSSNPQAVDPVAFQTADPTTTTVTGGVKVPNAITAKSYDPNVDAQTGAGFSNTSNAGGTDYSVGSDDLLKQNDSGQISGYKNNDTTILSAKGGPITQRVNRYDDGGGVSPSAAGMPPGLGGGQQAIPPIYYNPATYAGAGAPVGKGITQASSPTFAAGAIPSLPMVQGGAVKAFADGGGVGDDDLVMLDRMDQQDAIQDAGTPAAPATPTSDKDAGWYINPADSADASAASAPSGPPSGNARAAPTDSAPPTNPLIPQIHDDAGNPSKGLIGAIADGLHWLGDHLGLTGGGQSGAVATSPEQNQRQQAFVGGQNVGDMTPENYEELNKIADPSGQLKEGYRNLAGLEAGYRWALAKGDDATASRLAASYLHYSVNLSQNLSAKAQDALYAGDLKKAVDFTNQAVQAVPDGRNIHMELSPDGKTVKVTGSTLTGQQLWQKYGAAPEILDRASSLGKTGKLQWDALESQAAKYDSTFAGMQKARITNAGAQAKEDADTKAQADANEQIAKLGPQFGDQNAPTPAPPNADIGSAAPPAPAAPVASASAPPTQPAIPGLTPPRASPLIEQANAPVTRGVSGDGGGSSQIAAAPPDADQANAAPTRPAIPGPPTRENAALAQAGPQPVNPNAPPPDSQDVDLEHSVAYQSIPSQVKPTFFAPDGRPIVGGQVMNRPPVMDAVTLKSYAPQVQAAYNERWKEYNEAVQQNTAQMNSEIDGRRRDVAADIASGREQRGRAFTEQQANNRTGFQQQQENVRIAAQIKAKQESEQAARDHEDFAPRPGAEKVFLNGARRERAA